MNSAHEIVATNSDPFVKEARALLRKIFPMTRHLNDMVAVATIADALAKAVEAEREACAKVVEGWHVLRNGDMTIAKLATAIRARKEPTP